MQIEELLVASGGIASGARLRGSGISQDRLDRAVRAGRIDRLRRDWYGSPAADSELRKAVAAGGALTCVSVLRRHGVWLAPFDAVHVRVEHGSHARVREGLTLHWRSADVVHPVDDPARAMVEAARCLPFRDAVVAVDSVLSSGLLSADTVTGLLTGPPGGMRILARMDGRSQSGLETIARLALRGRGLAVEPQVFIPSVGRVDLLVGDRLVLELDGRAFHSGADFEIDRQRDLALTAAGYLVVRASYRQVMFGWDAVESAILQLVRRREHLWRAPARALGHEPRGYRG